VGELGGGSLCRNQGRQQAAREQDRKYKLAHSLFRIIQYSRKDAGCLEKFQINNLSISCA
jgi:hypothetical protein